MQDLEVPMPLETDPDFVAYLECRDHVRELALALGVRAVHCPWNPQASWMVIDEADRVLATGTLVAVERFLVGAALDPRGSSRG